MNNQSFFTSTTINQNKIVQIQDELDAGLKLIGWENYDIPFENDDVRVERIVSYKKSNKIIVFYLRNEDTFAMKIFNLKRGLSKTTANFTSISLRDVRTILTMF